MIGTITRVVADRGFGFTKGDNGTDYFFHRQEVGNGLDFAHLRQGARVAFEEQQGPKGQSRERAADLIRVRRGLRF